MKHGKYLIVSTVGYGTKVELANSIKSALKKGNVSKNHRDGYDFMLFKAIGNEIVRVDRTGKAK